jgi:hypothetical protein
VAQAGAVGKPHRGEVVTSRKLILRAFIASALLHLVFVALTWNVTILGKGHSVQAKADETVELVLTPDDAPAEAGSSAQAAAALAADPAADRTKPAAPELPNDYTEIPERMRSDTPPDHADFLAMFNARAADHRPGGEEQGPPAADVAGEFSQVAIAREDLGGAAGVRRPDPAEPGQEARSAIAPQGAVPGAPAAPVDPRGEDPWNQAAGESSPRDPREGQPAESARQAHDGQAWPGQGNPPSILDADRNAGGSGDRGFDFNQAAQGDLTGGTTIDGDFSLNTYAWNYAPWMHRFVQDLYRHWMAPYAYRLGVIYGVTRIRLVVEKDGRPSAMEVVEFEGHESLHRASLAALQTFAPYAPLPADFPEPQLVILLSLHYPQWK